MIKKSLMASSLVSLSVFSVLAKAEKKIEKKPNIVIFFADDLGYSDIGCYGGEIKTPNLDKLAAHGIRFTQFINGSKSAPSRASLLTGLYPIEAGCFGPPAQMINGVTLAEVLKPAGYRTLMSGKWHALENPVKRGFDRYFGCMKGCFNYFEPSHSELLAYRKDDKRVNPINDKNKDSFYTTDVFTDYAVNFLDEYKGEDKPFFLYLAYNAPHYPLQAWPEDIEKYKETYKCGWDVLRDERFARQKEMGIVKPGWKLSERDSANSSWKDYKNKDIACQTMATYAAMVDRMDQNIGRVIKKLKDLGIYDNTIVMFFSDNGANAEGAMWDGKDAKNKPGLRNSQAKQGDEWANASNTPFKKYKRSTFRGGECSPFIISWPEKIKNPGSINFTPINLIDIMPTFVDVSGGIYPEGKTWSVPKEGNLKTSWTILPNPGRSIIPLLNGKEDLSNNLFLGNFQSSRMVMKGKWKLVSDGGDGCVQHMWSEPWELYDIDKDGTETENLSLVYPNKVDSLSEIYEKWIDDVDRLNHIKDFKWYQPYFSKKDMSLVKELDNDENIKAMIAKRKKIGLEIVDELKKLNLKLSTTTGMDKIKLSYYGIVEANRKYKGKNNMLKNLYDLWDSNISFTCEYCRGKGAEFLKVWKMQEHVRPYLAENDKYLK